MDLTYFFYAESDIFIESGRFSLWFGLTRMFPIFWRINGDMVNERSEYTHSRKWKFLVYASFVEVKRFLASKSNIILVFVLKKFCIAKKLSFFSRKD